MLFYTHMCIHACLDFLDLVPLKSLAQEKLYLIQSGEAFKEFIIEEIFRNLILYHVSVLQLSDILIPKQSNFLHHCLTAQALGMQFFLLPDLNSALTSKRSVVRVD